jgi:hypothetical protein
LIFMHKNTVKYLFFVFIFISTIQLYSQNTNIPADKLTSTNIIPLVITDTRLGSIIQYYQGVELKTLYIPNDFYNSGKAVKVYDDSPNVTPQMSIIFKNSKAFRIKIYTPRIASSLTYRYKEILTDEEIEKFKTKELLVDFY